MTFGDGVVLPTANGGLSGALVRIVGDGLTGSAYYRVIASNTRTASPSPTPGAPA